mmetsp:Transcript_58486/g.163093  ORF Transcript_58486/g.163093 Transcript_58486/m.163093 type:complete len:254 (-) Transcript_58486:127-888(-)
MAAGLTAYRVEPHLPKHRAIRDGLKASRLGLPPPSESGTSVVSQSSALTADPVKAFVTGPAATRDALGAVWRRQGLQFYRPQERRPPSSLRSTTPSRRPGTRGSLSRCSSAAAQARPASSIDSLHLRCDTLLGKLMKDSAGQGGRGLERQAQLSDENYALLRHSSMVQSQTQQVADSLLGEVNGDIPPPPEVWPNPIANRVPPMYQTGYTRFFGLHDMEHLAMARQRAKSIGGHERYRTLSSWGADVTMEMNR